MNGFILSVCLGLCGKFLDVKYNTKINNLKILNTDQTSEILNNRSKEIYDKLDNQIICHLPKYYKDYRFFHIPEESTVLFIKDKVEFVLEEGLNSHTEYVYTNRYGTDGLYLQIEKYKNDFTLKNISNDLHDFKYDFDYLKTGKNVMYTGSVASCVYSIIKVIKKFK